MAVGAIAPQELGVPVHGTALLKVQFTPTLLVLVTVAVNDAV